MLIYRKTGAGVWVVYGPAAAIQAGATVTVAKKGGGTATEVIERVGQPFIVDGQQMIYGYPRPRASWSKASQRRSGRPRRECEECQWIEDASDGQGCSRHRGNPQN